MASSLPSSVPDIKYVQKYPVAGHQVAFPRPPYGVQLAFMSNLITAIDTRTSALLEAPTGCGKTLALLCGALAWQTKFKEAQADNERADRLALEQLRREAGVHWHRQYNIALRSAQYQVRQAAPAPCKCVLALPADFSCHLCFSVVPTPWSV